MADNRKLSSDLAIRMEQMHLHYFSDEEARNLRTQWADLSIRPEKPEVIEIASGLIHNQNLSFTINNKAIVGVYDDHNNPVDASIRSRGASEERGKEKKETRFDNFSIDDRVVYYLGVKARHYGHFLLETLCRAWAWEERGDGKVPVIQMAPIKEFARSLYSLLPGLAERTEIVSTPTRYNSVIVPFPAFVIASAAHVEFKAMCVRMAQRAVDLDQKTTEQPLYLSRAGLGLLAKRPIVDELRIERFLEQQGFHVIRPETLPVTEQIALINKHKWIVAPQGSACHTRLFSIRPNNFLMFTLGKVNPNFALCDMLCEGETHYAKTISRPDLGVGMLKGFVPPVVLEEDKFLTFLKQFGLVRNNATFDSPPVDIVNYKRNWIDAAKARAVKSKGNARLQKAIKTIEQSMTIS